MDRWYPQYQGRLGAALSKVESAATVRTEDKSWRSFSAWFKGEFGHVWTDKWFEDVGPRTRLAVLTDFVLIQGMQQDAKHLKADMIRMLTRRGFAGADFESKVLVKVQEALVQARKDEKGKRNQFAVVGSTPGMLFRLVERMEVPVGVDERMVAIACVLLSRFGSRVGEVAHTSINGLRWDGGLGNKPVPYKEVDQHSLRAEWVCTDVGPKCESIVKLREDGRLDEGNREVVLIWKPTSKHRKNRNEMVEMRKRSEAEGNEETKITNRLIDAMWWWAENSGASSVDLFFCRVKKGIRRALIPKEVAKLVKKVAEEEGLDPRFFSTSSLKRGLAAGCVKKGGSLADVAGLIGHVSTKHTAAYLPRGVVHRASDRSAGSKAMDLGLSNREVTLHGFATGLVRATGGRQLERASESEAVAASENESDQLENELRILDRCERMQPGACACGPLKVDTMIRCSSRPCVEPWFYLCCVGLAAVPTGPWRCLRCVGYRKGRSARVTGYQGGGDSL